MQQPDDQQRTAPVRLTIEQEFTAAFVKMGVLVCGAVVLDALTLLGMFVAYGGAELAVALRVRALSTKRCE